MNNTTTPDPITNQERVMVRQTATGFEQGIAATTGFFTAGPLGAVAAMFALRGLQGKWTPWFLLGIPVSIAINIFYVIVLVTAGVVTDEADTTKNESAMIRTTTTELTI